MTQTPTLPNDKLPFPVLGYSRLLIVDGVTILAEVTNLPACFIAGNGPDPVCVVE